MQALVIFTDNLFKSIFLKTVMLSKTIYLFKEEINILS